MRATLATLVMLASPALAGHNELSIGSNDRALRSSSANAVTGDSLSGGSFTYARALDSSPMPSLTVWLEGGAAWGWAKGMLFQTTPTEISMSAFTIGGRARWSPYQRLALSARLDLGSQRSSLRLTDSSGLAANGSGWSALAAAAAAIDVLAVDKPRFGIGLRLELGYVAARAVEITPTRAGSTADLKLPTMQASFGHLDLSGPYAGLSLISQF